MLKRLVVGFALALVVAACTAPIGDLEVTSLTPEPEATEVSVNTPIQAVFSRNVQEASLDGNFTLSASGVDFEGAVTYDALARTATFMPDTMPLLYGTVYTATVSGDVTTAAGASLDGDVSWSFTTEADPDPDPDPDPDTLIISVSEMSGVDEVGDGLFVVEGEAISLTFVATGGVEPYDIDIEVSDGALSGFLIEGATISGVADAVGNVAITATVTDGDGETSIEVVTFEVVATLEFLGAYEYAGDADIAAAIAVANPGTVGGLAPFTYSVETGAMPADVTTRPVDENPPGFEDSETYSVELNEDTGTINGSTPRPGVFAGTIRVTDALGQTADTPFTLDLDITFLYQNAFFDGEQTTFTYPEFTDTFFIVPGDRVLIGGLPTDALPDDESFVLSFELQFVVARESDGTIVDPNPTLDEVGSFVITPLQGTVRQVEAVAAIQSWTYDAVVEHDASGKTAEVQVNFNLDSYEGPVGP